MRMNMSKKIAFGVDLGWLSQLEAEGVTWVDEENRPVDPIDALVEMGADSIRLRIFVNPPKDAYWKKREDETCMLGFCDAQSVLEMSKRVKEKGLTLMLDFHYSDHFADPQFQDIPAAWKNDDNEGLKKRVYEHTKEVLTLFTQNDIYPEWVQIGNEINPGLLLPNGSKENPEVMVSFLNAGYEAVKECCPECQVITHVAGVDKADWVAPFLEIFFTNGGKTDIMGFSHYPYWYKMMGGEAAVTEDLQENLTRFAKEYKKPVMIVEVGGPENEEKETYDLLCDTIEALQNVPDDMGQGIYYWEPEIGKDFVPDQYPLGAAVKVGEKTIRFTKAMTAYKKYNV